MFKTIDGVRLAYDVAGSGDALVLLHGFPLDRTIWDAAFESLSQRYQVVRIDLRGSGESARADGPALMETLAGDVFGLLDALGIERAAIAGHSMGGYVALAYFRMYAERVAGLALVASQTQADGPQRAPRRDFEADAVTARGIAALVDSLAADLLGPAAAAGAPELARSVRALMLRQDPAGAAAQIIGMKERVDSGDLLEDIAVPALVVGGAADRLIPPERLERTAAAIADCEYVSLPGVGHLPMLEAPAATTAALERLMARCAATRSTAWHSGPATRV